MKSYSVIALAALALASATAQADKAKDPINDYLVNVGAGHVAAHELIGLTGSAVSNLQTPKELVAALAGLSDPSSKSGFGLAWSPGRSSIKLAGVSATDYQTSAVSRLWASTTFSYAQNTKTIANANYGQQAAAVNITYYLKGADGRDDDPLLVQYREFGGTGHSSACTTHSDALDEAAKELHSLKATRKEELMLRLKVMTLTAAQLDAIDTDVNALAARLKDKTAPIDRVRTAKGLKADPAGSAALRKSVDTALQQLDKCASDAGKKAADKWNASHVDLVLGQAWIRGDAAGSPRISLGRHVGLALAWAPPGHDGLLNLTYRRISGELDLDTLGKALAYKASSLVAARYTYRLDDRPGHQMYALAEASNAKANSGTTSGGAFKWALGLDRQVHKNAWVEFRAGRARIVGGTGEETKALLSLKLSPDSNLLDAIKAAGS